jgi:hypothetical protein
MADHENPERQSIDKAKRMKSLSLNLIIASILLLMTISITKASAFAAGPSDSAGGNDVSGSPEQNAIPQLPESTGDPNLRSIKLGETISFEEMGPVIINADGTTRRIDNWDQLTEQEKETAWRRISKRNEQRRQKLLEQQQNENPEL